MNPKFSVGEVVILQSKSLPNYNGEYTVKDIYGPKEYRACPVGSGVFGTDDTFTYNLGFSFEWLNGICDGWQESALRKNHEPSQQSFKELMSTLKSPQKA